MSTNGTSSQQPLILDRTGTTPIVVDGSMAIELLKRGYAERPSDRYNLSLPAVVEKIHHEFIEAGATLLQSNTVNANRYALEAAQLSARVSEINRKGVWLARAAAGTRAHVAGVIGPTGKLLRPLGPLETEDVLACLSRTSNGVACV